ncbi:MAG TPA: hypothetical protein VGA80_15175 [Flavobacteriaceae bacterium]
MVKTTGEPAKLEVSADRNEIVADGKDLSFITIKITDEDDLFVANANNEIEFMVEGSGEIIATDNGDPTDMIEFPSKKRKAFNGLALGIIRSMHGQIGTIKVTVMSAGLKTATIVINSN